ncbi:MAG: hypothetical protein ACOYWZ_07480 [Bacillota bacterium]
MSNENDHLSNMLDKLLKIKQQLTSINEKSGTLQRVHKMRDEILDIGWNGIVEKYHPDVNVEDPAANELFKMYKFVYEDMKRRLLISLES